MTIDAGSPIPVYQQLADILRARIASGELERRVPSIRTLMQEYELSYASVAHALKVMKDAGEIIGVPGKGMFVAGS